MPTTNFNQVESAGAVSLLTTELNSLASNGNTNGGPAVTNLATGGTTNLNGYFWGKVELYLAAYSGTPTSGTGVSLWFLKTVDGTNYEDGSSSVTPARQPDVVFQVRAVASGPQRIVKECWIPVGLFKAMARNEGTGITLAASGNTVKVLTGSVQGVS